MHWQACAADAVCMYDRGERAFRLLFVCSVRASRAVERRARSTFGCFVDRVCSCSRCARFGFHAANRVVRCEAIVCLCVVLSSGPMIYAKRSTLNETTRHGTLSAPRRPPAIRVRGARRVAHDRGRVHFSLSLDSSLCTRLHARAWPSLGIAAYWTVAVVLILTSWHARFLPLSPSASHAPVRWPSSLLSSVPPRGPLGMFSAIISHAHRPPCDGHPTCARRARSPSSHITTHHHRKLSARKIRLGSSVPLLLCRVSGGEARRGEAHLLRHLVLRGLTARGWHGLPRGAARRPTS